MKSVWSPTLVWIVAVAAALVLAWATPTESRVMGRLPELQAQRMDQRPVALPHGLDAERTLALISFHRDHRATIDGWIQGLQLGRDASVRWLRMAVVSDPGDDAGRNAIEQRLRERYGQEPGVLRVFTDPQAFARSAGLADVAQPLAVVVNRQGEVLARVQGPFDAAKAQTLRETLAP